VGLFDEAVTEFSGYAGFPPAGFDPGLRGVLQQVKG
jgi:hypothetical protein